LGIISVDSTLIEQLLIR